MFFPDFSNYSQNSLQKTKLSLNHHGGKLKSAAEKYGISLSEWLDLSTGINPNGWPVPTLPTEVWSRLPEAEDGLQQAAIEYYDANNCLPIPGSQTAIQLLPQLFSQSIKSRLTVGIIRPTYNEHEHAWSKNGHLVIPLSIDRDIIEKIIDRLDVLIVVNPNNPSGQTFPIEILLTWHKKLQQDGGWLIVDEAFIDTTPKESIVKHSSKPGLIILRSLGKFFGLAGIRVGFIFTEQSLLDQFNAQIGPWPVSTPARWIAENALRDTEWQRTNRIYLANQSKLLMDVLKNNNLQPSGDCSLFSWIKHDNAKMLHRLLAQQGIFTRLFDSPNSIRFGLPKNNTELNRLNESLASIHKTQTCNRIKENTI